MSKLDHSYDYKTVNERENILQELRKIAEDQYILVTDEEPPTGVELLVKAPNGRFAIASWRPAYRIFSCQSKGESTLDWSWKML